MNRQRFSRRSISETILRIDLKEADSNKQERYTSTSYVNILVVWGAVGKSLTKLLPFVDFSQIRKLLHVGATSFS